MTTKLTNPRDRITKAHIAIMRSPEFCMFSGVLSIGKLEMTDKLPTAGTNGRDVFYNPEFVNTLSTKELNFLVLHEAIHKVFQHMTMWKSLFKENAQLTNMSADYVVNSSIIEADPHGKLTHMPPDGLYDKKYDGMTTKQIYNILKQNPPPDNQFDEHVWEGAEAMSKEDAKTNSQQIDQALRQGEVLRGKMQGNKNRTISKLLEPAVDWREQMREFINSTCANKDVSTWKRPHRRFIGQDIYMPSLIGESIGSIVVGIDTSGSISDKDICRALTELVSICKDVVPKSIELLYWGSTVVSHETYEHDYDAILTSTKPVGGGGTCVSSVKDYIAEKRLEPEVIVIITDGYVESNWGGSWQHPLLWAVTTNAVAPNGKTITIKEK